MKKISILIAMLLFCSLASTMLVFGQTQPVIKLKFGNLGLSTSNLYQYLALERGIYKKFGIDLEFITFLKGGPEVIAAAASNQVDLGGLGTPILTGIVRGMPIKIIAAPPVKGQEFVLIARNDIKTIADLKGKTIGVSSVGGGVAQALRKIARGNNLNDDQYQTIAYGTNGNGYIALKSGHLAAAVLSEPGATQLISEGTGHLLAEAKDYFGRYQHSYIFATNKFIKEQPAAIHNFLKANREAIDYARSHVSELIAFGREKLKLEQKVLETLIKEDLARWDDSQSVDIEGTLNAVKIIQELGDIDKTATVTIEQLTDLRFQK